MPADTPVYPTARPAAGDADARFNVGLALDVAAVLPRHGYPSLATDAGLVRLQATLFSLIYQEKNR
jgi:hypothetical protein